MYPGKFNFDINGAPDCVRDYLAYGLNVAGALNGQANLLGINRLYSGAPQVSAMLQLHCELGLQHYDDRWRQRADINRDFAGRDKNCFRGERCNAKPYFTC